MLTTLIVFIASALVATYIVVNKMGQIAGAGWYVRLHSHEFEKAAVTRAAVLWDCIRHTSVRSLRSFSLKALESSEKFFIKIFFRVFRYISRLTNMVRGHDIPKNRGTASFFLKSIEERKNKVH